jgi:hypothetical protein
MSLTRRMYGYSFSEIEKELIFRRKDTGFVRYLTKDGNLFYLDPSPFFKMQKREVYAALCPPPPERTLIKVAVSDIKENITKDTSGYYRLLIKCASSWEKIDPGSLLKRKSLLSPEEVKEFFKLPFIGEEEQIERIAVCSALFTVSAPPRPFEKGGITAAIMGKKKNWSGFKKGMEIIPPELKQVSSDYFYRLFIKEEHLDPVSCREINLAYLNPDTIPLHIPLVLDVELKSSSIYKEVFAAQKPLVTAFMLDALIIEPVVSENLEQYIADAMYGLVSDVKGSGSLPYIQDFGSLLPRLGTSFARYNSRFNVNKMDIKSGIDLWSEMFYQAKKMMSVQHPVARMYRLSDNARKLYLDLTDAFGLDNPIPVSDIAKNVSLFKNTHDYDEALDDLNHHGLIIRLNNSTIKVLDFGKKGIS